MSPSPSPPPAGGPAAAASLSLVASLSLQRPGPAAAAAAAAGTGPGPTRRTLPVGAAVAAAWKAGQADCQYRDLRVAGAYKQRFKFPAANLNDSDVTTIVFVTPAPRGSHGQVILSLPA